MTVDEIVNIINNTDIRTITEFISKAYKMFPDIKDISVINKQEMGLSGIIATARFYVGMDCVIVKGFLYPNDRWTPETHGYVLAKKV